MSSDNSINASPDATAAGVSPLGTEPLACVTCRARKLKCDRTKPACSRCTKVSAECVYPESRRKPTYKRRNVKELEARLAQVETFLKEAQRSGDVNVDDDDDVSPEQSAAPDSALADVDFDSGMPQLDQMSNDSTDQPQFPPLPDQFHDIPQQGQAFPDPLLDNAQLIGLGMSEALPPFEVMEELHNVFFSTHYYMIPVIHPGRYFNAFYGGPLKKPPMCLQYAIWAMSALAHPKYDQYHELFYRRARQYVEADEMDSYSETFVSVGHAQALCLIASYEAKLMIFARGTITTSKLVRLCHMLGLNQVDGDTISPPPLGPPLSWAEMEERRRVFWGAYTCDAHCSIATGWPSLIQTEDIGTRLPASDDSFVSDRKEQAPFMHEIFQGASYTGFAGTVLICEVYKITLVHTHRSRPSDCPEDVANGKFWTRHRELDHTLSSIFMFLPEKFRLPQNARDPGAVYTNLSLHAAVICLHHAAVEMVEKYKLPEAMKTASVSRLRASAAEITNITQLKGVPYAQFKSALCPLSFYSATTVYVYLSKQSEYGLDTTDTSNLETILGVMEMVSRHHGITQAFLWQACRDITRNGLDDHVRVPTSKKPRNTFDDLKAAVIPAAAQSYAKPSSNLGTPIFLKNSGARREDRVYQWFRAEDLAETTSLCFQPLLGPVSRNIAAPPAPHEGPNSHGHKRRRTEQSPRREAGSSMVNTGEQTTVNLSPMFGEKPAEPVSAVGPGPWRPDAGFNLSGLSPAATSLPDRTNSSISSPAHQASGSKLPSPSSHTSAEFGLGKTLEENRVDLQVLQERISATIWQSTDEELMAQMNEAVVPTLLSSNGADAWGLLATDGSWEMEPGGG